MKEITYVLMGRIKDPETRSLIYLNGVEIKGTPLQVAAVFENLFRCPGKVDVSVSTENDKEVYEVGENTLKAVRESQGSAEFYEDPDKTDEDARRRAREPSRWKIEIT